MLLLSNECLYKTVPSSDMIIDEELFKKKMLLLLTLISSKLARLTARTRRFWQHQSAKQHKIPTLYVAEVGPIVWELERELQQQELL